MAKKNIEELSTRILIKKMKWVKRILIMVIIIFSLYIIIVAIGLLFLDLTFGIRDIFIPLGVLGVLTMIPGLKKIKQELKRRNDK